MLYIFLYLKERDNLGRDRVETRFYDCNNLLRGIGGEDRLFAAREVLLQADGQELEEIIDKIGDKIPYLHKDVMRWSGDLARFIILNV